MRPEAPGVWAKDSIPNFAIIGNCRLGNGQGFLFSRMVLGGGEIHSLLLDLLPESELLRLGGRTGRGVFCFILYMRNEEWQYKNLRHIFHKARGDNFVKM